MTSRNQQLLNKLTDSINSESSEQFCKRLQEVVKRQGGFSKLSEQTSLSRESLYKALSGERDPRLSTIVAALSALGIKLRFEVDKQALEQQLAGISGFEGAWLDLYLLSPQERLERADQAVATYNELSLIDETN